MRVKVDYLDKLASEYVRRRAIQSTGGCERCLSPKYGIQKEDGSIYPDWKQLQCCHFHSRRNRSTRYDPDNLAGLCFGCHQYLDSHPYEKIEFFRQRLGDAKLDLLNARVNQREKPDIEAITLYLKMKIKEVSDE